MDDIFKLVPGYESCFAVSREGQVWSVRSKRLLKTTINKNGYVSISTRLNGRNSKCVCLRVHRMVALTWIPNPENKPEVNHIDGVKTNNDFLNLEWVTTKENIIHSWSNGLAISRKGCSNSCSKLSNDQIDYLRSNPDNLSNRKLAKIVGLHWTNVSKILRGVAYTQD